MGTRERHPGAYSAYVTRPFVGKKTVRLLPHHKVASRRLSSPASNIRKPRKLVSQRPIRSKILRAISSYIFPPGKYLYC